MATWSVTRKGADGVWTPQHNKWTGLPIYNGDIEVISVTPTDVQMQSGAFDWNSPSALYHFTKDA